MFYKVLDKGTPEGATTLQKLYTFLKEGTYLVTFQHLNPQADEPTYRAAYFAKLQNLADETGHSKPEMHEIIKEHVLAPLYNKHTTKKGSLTLEEWVGLLKSIDIWAFQTYDIVIS